MDKQELKKLIDTAAGRIPADLVIKNCKVVNVFSGEIISGDIAVSGSKIAGIGEYEGREVVDAEGSYAAVSYTHLLRNKKKVCALLAPTIDKILENFSQCQM